MSCLYILEINPLSVASFANVFSQFVVVFLFLFMVSFVVKKLLSLIRSFFFFFLHCSRRRVQKITAAIYVKEYSAYVFLQEFYSIRSYI